MRHYGVNRELYRALRMHLELLFQKNKNIFKKF